MTPFHYRILVAASFLIGIFSGSLDLVFPGLVPESIRAAQAEHDESLSISFILAGLLFGVPGLCLALAGTYGLFFFRRWGPRIALIGTVLVLFTIAMLGTSAQSGLGTSLAYLSSYLWGAAILVPYVPGYGNWFKNKAAIEPSGV